MSKKKLWFVPVAMFMAAFAACGGDSSSNAKDDVPKYKNLPDSCKAGEEAEVRDTVYTCVDGEWVVDAPESSSSKNTKSSSSSQKKKSSSSSLKSTKSSSSSAKKSSSSMKKESSSSVVVSSSAKTGKSSSSVTSSSSKAKMPSSSSSSSALAKSIIENFLNPSVTYGNFTDNRDGQVYKTVVIGDQVWFAQNLNLKYQDGKGSFCYDDKSAYCDTLGRLYTWGSAMDTAGVYSNKAVECGEGKECKLIVPVRGICPDKWRLPSKNDWEKLISYAGGESNGGVKLRAAKRWKWLSYDKSGTDDFGFSALPSGVRDEDGDYSEGNAYFWASTEESNIYVYIVRFRDSEKERVDISTGDRTDARSVRCVRDLEEEPSSGSFTDSRDGQTYKTVKIGNQTWMAQNLNYAVEGSVCYNNDKSNCEIYGRLYTWTMALNVSESDCGLDKKCPLSGDVQGICPDGWRMPKLAEFETLFEDVGGESVAGVRLKSKGGWHPFENNGKEYGNGSDILGFNVLAAGDYSRNGHFEKDSVYTYMWIAGEGSAATGRYAFFSYYSDGASTLYEYKDNYYSVRCIKNKPSLKLD